MRCGWFALQPGCVNTTEIDIRKSSRVCKALKVRAHTDKRLDGQKYKQTDRWTDRSMDKYTRLDSHKSKCRQMNTQTYTLARTQTHTCRHTHVDTRTDMQTDTHE